MVELSRKTEQLIAELFAPGEQARAAELLATECGDNLPLIGASDPKVLERVRFAALRGSQGDLDRLIELVGLAQRDWRDLLVLAGFAHSVSKHQRWADQILNSE